MKVLVFTAESNYARFRCPFSTTSALTFSTIHPVAVKGLIGSILGIDYKKLFDFSRDIQVGISILNIVNKDTQSFNLIAMEGNNGAANFQSRVEFLRDVKYRIFIKTNENKINDLKTRLMKHDYCFTPYLGCSENIAKLSYEGVFDDIISNKASVNTIIPSEYFISDFSSCSRVYTDRLPIENDKYRRYTKYNKVVFSIDGYLTIKPCNLNKVGEYNVFFF